jgi:hypothetical protein
MDAEPDEIKVSRPSGGSPDVRPEEEQMKTMPFGRWASLTVAALVCLVAVGPVFAQSTTARVEGIVTDDSGAAVPGASVTATNTATNFARTVTTDSAGSYVLTPLPIGPYQVKVELQGFKSSSTKANLNINDVARIDLKLSIGAQTEVVEVIGAAPIIEKTTSGIGTVIDRKQVENLPLNGRNFTQLATLSTGVNRGVPGGNASGESGNAETFRYGENGGAAISVNGVREQGNNFQLDGVDNNEILVNSVVFFPPIEALQEFRVMTANAPAEFGRAGGAVTNLITKSGSNQFHGSVYEFNRNKGLASTPEFAVEKPDFSRNQFGATLGGPIVKDKTFFFLSYSGLRSTIPVEAGGKVTVPTARMRNGDFSELLNPAFSGTGGPVIVYNPATGQPFPGNIIPANLINPVGQRYLNVFPLPDLTDRAQQNYYTHRERKSTFDDFDARIDHQFSKDDTMFLRFSFANDNREDPGRIPGYQAGFGSGTAKAKAYGGALGETKVFSPSVVNELRLGYNHLNYAFLPVGYGINQDQLLGIPGPGGITVDNGISLIGGGNGSYIEYLGDFGQYDVTQKTFQLSDSVTWLKGRHNFKFGGTVLRRDMQAIRTNVGKGFYFYRDGLGYDTGYTGYEVSDMLIGKTNFTATGVPGYAPRTTVSWENSVFAQDDFRVNSKLTLNLGLRYDVFTPYYEKDDQLGNFNPTFDSAGNITGGTIIQAGKNGASRSTVDTDWNNIGPRVGFAYQIDAKTVLRGGYGIFYGLDRGGIDNQLTENPPAVVTQYRFSGPGANVALSQPIPLPVPVDPNNPVLPDGSGVIYTPQQNPTNRYQQYNIGVQRELTPTTALMVAYVGTHGDDLTAILSNAGFSGDIQGRLQTVSNVGTSRYNSLQVSLRRTAADFNYLASYTLGKATNDSPGPYPGPSGNLLSSPTPGIDEGPADFDVRHRFTFAATYNLPFAKDDKILGGWAVNGIITLQSGNPFTVFGAGKRADQNGDPNNGPKTVAEWFDTSVFSVAAGEYGSAPRNSVIGPSLRTVDMSLFKTFGLGERVKFEFRFEGFNIFNTAQYSFPNYYVDSADFGKISSTRLNSERQFQLAGRLTF